MLTLERSPSSPNAYARIVRAEYLEDPGLSLTSRQMQRLWSLDASTCEAVLQSLLAAGFLERRSNDTFVHTDVLAP
jgi:hypothetical protein